MTFPATDWATVGNHYRIGEAKNPGPRAVHFLDDSDGSIQEEDDQWMADEVYPDVTQSTPQVTTLKLQELIDPLRGAGGAAASADHAPGGAPAADERMDGGKQVLSQS